MLKNLVCLLFAVAVFSGSCRAENPLRVYLRSGAAGAAAGERARFEQEWTKLLTDRGASVTGGDAWPSAEQLKTIDVLLVCAPDAFDVPAQTRADLDKFAERGGGFVVLHDGLRAHADPAWMRGLVGGAWHYDTAKTFEGNISLYYVKNDDPIVLGASNFDLPDAMVYDLDVSPDADVLAATWTPDARAQRNGRPFPSIYNVAPQIWSFDDDVHRAFVDLLGSNPATFALPQVRAVILRGIAWAGQMENVDALCSAEELGSLRYPSGGPSRPADSLAKMSLHPEFTMGLVAAEPLINKPIALDWDARGRLWVAETPEYPNGRRGLRADFAGVEWKDHGGLVPQAGRQVRAGRDRISILEPRNGATLAERKHVFFSGLELVTGFVFHGDGVIVAAAPDIFWLRDPDGTGKATKVVKLYTGLGTRDTHAVINNLRWGFDGWIYATHGYSGSNRVTSGDGSKDFGHIGAGVVRFKPDGSAFEQYSSKAGNTWGLAITPENEMLWTQATSGDLLMQTILPESVLARGRIGDTAGFKIVKKSPKSFPLMTWEQQAYRQIDMVGSFTAADGCAIYDGGTWPARFNRSYFTTEPTINIVHQEFLTPDGVSFSAHKEPGREETEFLRAKDLWFRPIENRVGPDGALYVLDFYNQAVIHNDTRGPVHNNVNAAVRPDRDHYFGRIWRIEHREAAPLAVPDLSKASAAELIATLDSPNGPTQMTAHRLLLERPLADESVAALRIVALDANRAASARIHALWILHVAGRADAALVAVAIAAPDPVVARNALKIAAEAPTLAVAAAAQVIARLNDPEPRTQLAALLAAGGLEPTLELTRTLVALVPALTDPFRQTAALASASRAPAAFLTAALEIRLPAAGQPDFREFVQHLARLAAVEPESAARLVIAIAELSRASQSGAIILRGLAEGSAEQRIPRWNGALQQAFTQLLAVPELQAASIPLALAWDREGTLTPAISALLASLQPQLHDPAQTVGHRERLVDTLVAARHLDPGVLPGVAALLGSDAPIELQKHAIGALGESGDPAAGEALVGAYPKLAPILQGDAFAQILKRPAWTRAFVDLLKTRAVTLEQVGTIGIDKLRHYPDPAVAKLATATLDALRKPLLQQKDQLIASLLPTVAKDGDPARGHQLFTSACAVCHHFNGEGGHVAPDLTGMGAHPRAELLTDIVDPNREIDPSFIAYDFLLKNGESYQGIIARENSRTVLVRDAGGEHELKKIDLEGRRELGRSLMPEGFESLGAESLRDLLAYLQSGDARFRIIDLRQAADADSRQSLFAKNDRGAETLHFRRFGDVRVGDVPFVILDPSTASTGKNLIVLRGGDAPLSKSYPKKVEIPMGGIEADVLEILGGVGGWAFPCCGDEKGGDMPVVKMTAVYTDGTKQEIVLKNGVEFADFSRPHDVPGSKNASELVNGEQVRVIREPLAKLGALQKLILESYDTRVAPVFVAITAEKSGTRPAAPLAAQAP